MSYRSLERMNFMTPWPVRIWRGICAAAKSARFNRMISKNTKGPR